jgi:hypothetical protein
MQMYAPPAQKRKKKRKEKKNQGCKRAGKWPVGWKARILILPWPTSKHKMNFTFPSHWSLYYQIVTQCTTYYVMWSFTCMSRTVDSRLNWKSTFQSTVNSKFWNSHPTSKCIKENLTSMRTCPSAKKEFSQSSTLPHAGAIAAEANWNCDLQYSLCLQKFHPSIPCHLEKLKCKNQCDNVFWLVLSFCKILSCKHQIHLTGAHHSPSMPHNKEFTAVPLQSHISVSSHTTVGSSDVGILTDGTSHVTHQWLQWLHQLLIYCSYLLRITWTFLPVTTGTPWNS